LAAELEGAAFCLGERCEDVRQAQADALPSLDGGVEAGHQGGPEDQVGLCAAPRNSGGAARFAAGAKSCDGGVDGQWWSKLDRISLQIVAWA